MNKYIVTGFTIHDVWASVIVETIEELITKRASEKGIVKIITYTKI